MKELGLKPKVSIVKIGRYHIDVVMKEMSEPAKGVQCVRDYFKTKGVDKKLRTTPPFDPETYQIKRTAQDFYGPLLSLIVEKRDDMDEAIPHDMKPITKWPVKEAKRPSWSMEHGGVVFARADFQEKEAIAEVRVLKEFRIKEVVVNGEEAATLLRETWRTPWRLQLKVLERSAGGLARAPDFAQVREEAKAKAKGKATGKGGKKGKG